MHLGQASSEHGKVLREDESQAAVDRAISRHDAVARHALLVHAKVLAKVLHELVILAEASGVQQHFEALACCQLTLLVLLGNSVCATAQLRLRALLAQDLREFMRAGIRAQRTPCRAPQQRTAT